MDKQIYLHAFVEQELRRYKKMRDKFYFLQKSMPEGSLVLRDEKLYRFLRENGRQYSMRIDENDPVARELRQKQFIKKALPLLETKIEACEKFLSSDLLYDPELIEAALKEQYRGISGLNLFLEDDLDKEALQKTSFIKNPYPIKQKHYTASRRVCRSKSEAMIGTSLEARGLTYWNDAQVILKSGIIYTDFIILLPKRRKLVYLEHFGKIDQPDYAVKNFKRIRDYAESNIYLGINLFYTFETRDKPLTTKEIDRILDMIEELDNWTPQNN